ncbi:hypothetical protein PPERSA_02961 [Pseudocohnilembus persalinus]|uniref:RING-type domain-containing protein n=1 Tax=Pseudocohnilembus persalinus TaxID=266149 RepID=A0A0V0QA72_PSEPJ|nr:hypothetical protein PPERSA_02961 [Pseudocohnilembus persalinus]|eukprot:KRW99129.1 hypothetical protein PPERSA_02961 [Pseudocohnilembus persalinus]
MQSENNSDTIIKVTFKIQNQHLELKDGVIKSVNQIIDHTLQSNESVDQEQFQLVILSYKVPNKVIARRLIQEHNLEYTGVSQIHIEEQVEKSEYTGMQLYNKVVLEINQKISIRELFTYMFDKFGEVFRIKPLHKNKKQVQVIFRHFQGYRNFLLYLKENMQNMRNGIYFEVNNEKVNIIEYSQTSINIEKPQLEPISQEQTQFIQREKQGIQSNNTIYQNNTQQKGNLILITQFSDLKNLVYQLQKIGPLFEIDLYEGKKQQQLLYIRYKNILDEQKMMEAYAKLQFTNLDNLNLLITKQRCKYSDTETGCTNRQCQSAHISLNQVTCRNIFYQKCKDYQQNKCQYLHIGPQNISKKQKNKNESKMTVSQVILDDSDSSFSSSDDEGELNYNQCTICFSNEIQTDYIHCENSAFCQQCAEKIQKKQIPCPFCTQQPQQPLKKQAQVREQSFKAKNEKKVYRQIENHQNENDYEEVKQQQEFQKKNYGQFEFDKNEKYNNAQNTKEKDTKQGQKDKKEIQQLEQQQQINEKQTIDLKQQEREKLQQELYRQVKDKREKYEKKQELLMKQNEPCEKEIEENKLQDEQNLKLEKSEKQSREQIEQELQELKYQLRYQRQLFEEYQKERENRERIEKEKMESERISIQREKEKIQREKEEIQTEKEKFLRQNEQILREKEQIQKEKKLIELQKKQLQKKI